MSKIIGHNSPLTVAVVGPHYAGKSTLSRLLQKELDFRIFQEEWWKDPFKDMQPRDYFRSEIWYMQQSISSMLAAEKLNQEGQNVILDTFIYSNLIFAETKMKKEEFVFFKELLSLIAPRLPLPDIVIYLYADPKYLYETHRMRRVEAGTGPSSDKDTPYDWYEQICQLNDKYFSNWNQTPLLKMDVQHTDFRTEENFTKMLEDIRKLVEK
nr:Deoxynucleoside kinase [uncultured bacterium]